MREPTLFAMPEPEPEPVPAPTRREEARLVRRAALSPAVRRARRLPLAVRGRAGELPHLGGLPGSASGGAGRSFDADRGVPAGGRGGAAGKGGAGRAAGAGVRGGGGGPAQGGGGAGAAGR